MDAIAIIEKYYKKDSDLYKILIRHSTDVMNKAVSIAENHPELGIDVEFVKEAGMLHDIGIFLTNAPNIYCYGIAPYLAHGYLGRELLEKEGLPKHALVCERHTGAGISLEEIERDKLPLPARDMIPVSIEEKLVCFADCFYSKTHLGEERSVEKVREGMLKHGAGSVARFDEWSKVFM